MTAVEKKKLDIKHRKAQVQISLEPELLKDLDAYCKKNYTNRSNVIAQAVTEKVNQQKIIDTMHDLGQALKIAARTGGEISEELQEKISNFEELAALFKGGIA